MRLLPALLILFSFVHAVDCRAEEIIGNVVAVRRTVRPVLEQLLSHCQMQADLHYLCVQKHPEATAVEIPVNREPLRLGKVTFFVSGSGIEADLWELRTEEQDAKARISAAFTELKLADRTFSMAVFRQATNPMKGCQ